MKIQSNDFIAKEEGNERLPGELYHFWRGSTHWRYTSGDVEVYYNGNVYTPAPIQRRSVTYDSKLQINSVSINMSRIAGPASQFIAATPVDLVWVSIHKFHRDLVVEETTPIFIGQIKSISFKGTDALVNCVGFEQFLRQVVPRYRFGPSCQHTLYDTRCGVDSSLYSRSLQPTTISIDGLIITSSVFDEQSDYYYALGYLYFGDYKRMITYHIGDTIKIRYAIAGLNVNNVVTVCAGCDKSRDTCLTKFNNIDNHFGFTEIPDSNPAIWSS